MHFLRVILLAIPFAAGCGPAVAPEDMGRVVHEVPAVPGAETPYPLPELEASASEAGDHAGHQH